MFGTGTHIHSIPKCISKCKLKGTMATVWNVEAMHHYTLIKGIKIHHALFYYYANINSWNPHTTLCGMCWLISIFLMTYLEIREFNRSELRVHTLHSLARDSQQVFFPWLLEFHTPFGAIARFIKIVHFHFVFTNKGHISPTFQRACRITDVNFCLFLFNGQKTNGSLSHGVTICV
jgi:hypothetical protein